MVPSRDRNAKFNETKGGGSSESSSAYKKITGNRRCRTMQQLIVSAMNKKEKQGIC